MVADEKITYRLGKWIVREDWPLWLLMAVVALLATLIYPSLPPKIPMHWNIHGQIDGWGDKLPGVAALPAIAVVMYLLLLILPLIDPRRENYPKFRSTYRFIRFVLVVFLIVLWALMMAMVRGAFIDMGRVIPMLVSILIVLIGSRLSGVGYNWFVGIRTPWSLSNEEAWRRTHQAGGVAFVIGGCVSLAGGYWGGEAAAWAMGLGIGGAALFSVIYSYFAWKQSLGSGPAGPPSRDR